MKQMLYEVSNERGAAAPTTDSEMVFELHMRERLLQTFSEIIKGFLYHTLRVIGGHIVCLAMSDG